MIDSQGISGEVELQGVWLKNLGIPILMVDILGPTPKSTQKKPIKLME